MAASFCLVTTGDLFAASISEQKAKIRRVGTYLRSAERLVKADRSDEAGQMFSKAQGLLKEVAQDGPDEKLKRSFDRAVDQLAESHAALTKAGVSVEALESIEPNLAGNNSPSPEPPGRFDPRQVSFARDVAPMLASKCGRCHIDRQSGGFSLATYEDLMRGTPDGRVLVPGDGQTSLIVELIASGDMPRGGGRVTPQETQKLVEWISQGARFDGPSERANLRNLLPPEIGAAPPRGAAPPPAVTKPTGKETVSFALDVAPILSANCAECHGATRPRGGLSVADFQRLAKGGDGGPVVRPGDPDSSPLVRRLTGADTPRMPMNRDPLSDEQIQKIATWVREGATFDGPDARAPLNRVTNLVRAERATAEELNQLRVAEAEKNWRLAMPREPAATVETDHFHVVGNLPDSRLAEIGAEAERLADGVLKLFGHPRDEQLSKSRITLFAFGQRIDYAEFAQMVRKQQAPKDERGCFGYTVVDAYAAVQLAPSPEPGDTAALAEPIAAVYLSERTGGRLPDWLVDGAAKVAAARADPKDDRVRKWQESLPNAVASVKQPTDIFSNRLPPAQSGVLRHGFVDGIMRKPARIHAIIRDVASGKDVDAAFHGVFKGTAEQLAPVWIASVRGRR